jgi:hypothetical protein
VRYSPFLKSPYQQLFARGNRKNCPRGTMRKVVTIINAIDHGGQPFRKILVATAKQTERSCLRFTEG